MRPRHMAGFIQWAAHYSLYTSFPPGHDDVENIVDGDYDDDDDDDDDDGFPANSPHDKIPPWWEYVINR